MLCLYEGLLTKIKQSFMAAFYDFLTKIILLYKVFFVSLHKNCLLLY